MYGETEKDETDFHEIDFQYRGSNSHLRAYKAGAFAAEQNPQPLLYPFKKKFFLRNGLAKLPRLSLNLRTWNTFQ